MRSYLVLFSSKNGFTWRGALEAASPWEAILQAHLYIQKLGSGGDFDLEPFTHVDKIEVEEIKFVKLH